MKKQFGVLLLCSLLTLLLAACGHTHNFGEWQTIREASCEEPGLKIQECRCGAEKEREIPTLEHKYKVGEEVESSCQAAGQKTYVCTRCNDSYTEPMEQRKYTASELNEMYLESVGDLVVYDRKGNAISLGSCFVYSEDGLLITNYHVIEDGYFAEVTIGNITHNIQQVVAYDYLLDIAVLKIPVKNLKPATICDLNHKTGETVYALGNSQGLTSTFSKGMITYSDREYGGTHYVQHDAPISSGNSGGPLINEYGEVIGINTLTLEDSQNLNFAISISELDWLDYEEPLTMAEFYYEELNPYQKIAVHLEENGIYREEYGTYVLMLDTVQSPPYDYKIWAEYVPDKAVIDFFLSVNDDLHTVLSLDETRSGIYDWYCFDDNYEMAGRVIASKLTYREPLTYDYTNVTSSDMLESMREVASTSVRHICNCITARLGEIGVTAKLFGFIYF